MKSIYIIGLFIISPLANICSQDGYLLTERITQGFFEGELTNGSETVYMYDDEERLVRSETAQTYTIHTYEGNNITIENFSFSDNEIINRSVEVRNQDEFRLVYSYYLPTGNGLELISVDSLTRNSDNQIIQYTSYRDSGYGFEKSTEENTLYTSDGNIFSVERLNFFDGTTTSIISTSNLYDTEGFIERAVIKTENLLDNIIYSDTVNYVFDQGEMISSEFKNYKADGFSSCTLSEFKNGGDLQTTKVSKSYNIDCSDLELERKTEYLSNDDILFGLESIIAFYYKDDSTFEIASSQIYLQDGMLGDNEIMINIETITFESEQEAFKFIRDSKFRKSELVSNKNVFLNNEVKIFPSVIDQKGFVKYEANDVVYDNIKIVDINGQTIIHEPIMNKRNQYFVAPDLGGLYFVQLFKGESPITKATKLIVK